ncbi:MAG: hypothetical protein NC392_06235 [Roseburia sp.]|nr:hypothetical protein [Roseburia sp.]MCM1202050.1 hypothetical protein [Bacteroides fragilis]
MWSDRCIIAKELESVKERNEYATEIRDWKFDENLVEYLTEEQHKGQNGFYIDKAGFAFREKIRPEAK